MYYHSHSPLVYKIQNFAPNHDSSIRILLWAHLRQVPVAKKKSKPVAKETSEEVKAVTTEEKLADALADALKEAGVARTSAITLAGLDYAENLGDAIKKHYNDIECLYTHVQKTMKGKPTEKELNHCLKKIEEKAQATKKLQARLSQLPTYQGAMFTANWITCP